MTSEPWILGLSASHNGAACLLRGQHIVAAIQEERLVGMKRARLYGARPSLAVQYCLEQGGIGPGDLDMVVLCAQTAVQQPENDLGKNPQLRITENGTRTAHISHHAGHAAGVFATSGFDEATLLIVDGMGSPNIDLSANEKAAVIGPAGIGAETNSIYGAKGTGLQALEKHMVPQGRWLSPPPAGSGMPGFGSLGGMFSAVAAQVFGNSMDAGKVMGLAPYGTATLDPEEFFTIRDGQFIFHDHVPGHFTDNQRWPHRQKDYEDLAASTQQALELALLYLVRRVHELGTSPNLAYAGGVALNSVANERIIRESGFEQVYIMPAAEDSGPAIGAAYHGLWTLTGQHRPQKLERDGHGRIYAGAEISSAIASMPAIVTEETGDWLECAADLLAEGKIIAWFDGPSEFGPRSLGQRSILCDPRQADAKERLNARVKHREAFRPFAPVLPLEEVHNWFELKGSPPESPFMLRVMDFRDDRKDQVPGVVHVDGSGRVQTVTEAVNGNYYRLLKAFGARTGVPMLINTSLNIMGEPIVETPEDALWCLLLTGLDACVFEGSIVTRKSGYQSFAELYPYFLLPGDAIRRTRDGQGLLFNARTPWGPYPFALKEAPIVAILERLLGDLMDGTKNTGEIFQSLQQQAGTLPEAMLIRLFAQLRRWRLISFREQASPARTTIPVPGPAMQPASATGPVDEGLALLLGRGVGMDAEKGIALIEGAAKEDARAAWLAATIASASFWRQSNWNRAFDFLQRAAELDHKAARVSLRILAAGPRAAISDSDDWAGLRRHIDMPAWLQVVASETLHEEPALRVFNDFIPAAACDWLIGRAKDRLSRATIYDNVTGGTTEDQRRTNAQCDLDIEHCGVLTFVIRARIGAITGRPDPAMEVPKILHYAPGDTFAEHFDYLDPTAPAYARQLARRGQRVKTLLIYLNDDYQGGKTHFPALGISHAGRKGSAFLFDNVNANGEPDDRTLHAGLPPSRGEKWVFSQWIRALPRT